MVVYPYSFILKCSDALQTVLLFPVERHAEQKIQFMYRLVPAKKW